MTRNWKRYAASGLPILSAALLSAVGLLWDGAQSSAAAQAGSSDDVVVNYDALNALPGQSAPYGAQPTQPVPAYTSPPAIPYAAPLAPGRAPRLVPAPTGMPTSALTVVGPDGRPITPIKLKKPGSEGPAPTPQPQVAAVAPPDEPAAVPAEVPMPEPTPPAPAPGVNAGQSVSPPAVETPAPPAPEATAPAPETPAPEEAAVQPAEPPADEQPVQEQTAQDPPPAETPTAETAPADAEPASGTELQEQPVEQAAVEPAAEPDNSQPAPPIPQGGIRIVFPADLNDVPVEANAALDDLAAQMLADEDMRIQIMCYASGNKETESKARRRSLARCISIRQYLFKKDVRTTRMDVRALGLKSEGQPADRVDIVPANS